MRMTDTDTSSHDTATIAIIGMGPRGIAVLEHLALHLKQGKCPPQLRILAIDDHQVGAGRIWRADQPDWLMMNTVTSQVTMFSGPQDGKRHRAGAGPTLYEWLRDHPDPQMPKPGPNEYAPRVVYGQYLRMVYETIVADMPWQVRVEAVHARVASIRKRAGSHTLLLADGRELHAINKVVLTTGHPQNRTTGKESTLEAFARAHPGLTYIAGNSAADMPLQSISTESTVGIIGMGLGFYDILLSLTVGRGGKFETTDNQLRYIPSGREPKIVAGSRSGVPILARGANQKPVGVPYRSLFMTAKALQEARFKAVAFRGSEKLDFQRDVYPLIQAEVEHVYFKTHVRHRRGAVEAERFAAAHAELVHSGHRPDIAFLDEHGLADVKPIDLYQLARPFSGQEFDSTDDFHRVLTKLMAEDLDEARRGNIDSPLKAALDVLRDVRDLIRVAVDFGGLHPRSYREDFLGRFGPVCSLLSAGPPAIRIQQALALIESGNLMMIGPETAFSCDEERGKFLVTSSRVLGSDTWAEVLIDSRVPLTSIINDTSSLIRDMLSEGLIREYVIESGADPAFCTGGLAVTDSPFHVIGADGKPNADCYALGIPTEHTRWFTQVGSDTPNASTRFGKDADAIAADICTSLVQRRASADEKLAAV